MAHPYHHALSSVKKWGGTVEDYQPIHDWFDETKALLADFRHRALRHHAEGIFLCEQVFGTTITLSTCAKCGKVRGDGHDFYVEWAEGHVFVGKVIPVRWVGEQHVTEDLGHVPAAVDWLRTIQAEPWMNSGARRLSRELVAQV